MQIVAVCHVFSSAEEHAMLDRTANCRADQPKSQREERQHQAETSQDELATTPSPYSVQAHMRSKRLHESLQGQHHSRECAMADKHVISQLQTSMLMQLLWNSNINYRELEVVLDLHA